MMVMSEFQQVVTVALTALLARPDPPWMEGHDLV